MSAAEVLTGCILPSIVALPGSTVLTIPIIAAAFRGFGREEW